MTYKILSTRQIKEILFTHVEFIFSFGVMEIEIPHFFPETISDEAFQTAIDYKIKEFVKIVDKLGFYEVVNGIFHLLNNLIIF